MKILLVYPVNPDLFKKLRLDLESLKEKPNSQPLELSGIAAMLPVSCRTKIITRKISGHNNIYNDNTENFYGWIRSGSLKNINDLIYQILNDAILDKYFPENMKCNFIITKYRWKYLNENDPDILYIASYISVYNSILKVFGDLALILRVRRKSSALFQNKTEAGFEKKAAERTAALLKENEELKKKIKEGRITQQQMVQSLSEKETLLSEIHHRVKNNLQTVSSLLSLQSSIIKDEKVRQIFKAGQNRIRSMVLIHERLSLSGDHNKTEMSKYIKSLGRDLCISYNVKPDQVNIAYNLTPLSLQIDHAIICGLIINELLSNSLKHAFPGNTKGEISVEMESADNKCILAIRDNGIGFPKELDFRSTTSIGLRVVTSLTEQLNGKILMNNGKGTEFKLSFPVK